MGIKEKCIYCEVEIDSSLCKTTKTEDGATVCISCYYKIFNELFKGQFTYKQGLEALHNIDKYEKLINDYLLTVKKLVKVNNMNYKKALNLLIGLEENIAQYEFNMTRKAALQDKKKHYAIIKYIYDYGLLEVIFPITDITNVVISSNSIDYDARSLGIEYKQLTSNKVNIV